MSSSPGLSPEFTPSYLDNQYSLTLHTYFLLFVYIMSSPQYYDNSYSMAFWDPSEGGVAHYWDNGGNFGAPQPPQQRLNAQAAQLSTSKVPPYWTPELELQGYPFRTYLQDVRIWSSSSELNVEAQGGAVVQRLGGVARSYARDVDPEILRNGRFQLDNMGQQIFDLQGNPVVVSGLELLLNGLARKFGAREFETSVSSVIELLTFRRTPREPIDDCLGRFELIRKRANEHGDFQMGVGGLSWMLLHQLGIHKMHWPLLLTAHQGRFPRDEPGFEALLTQIRDQCHLLERSHAGARTLEEGWRFPAHTGSYWTEPSAATGADGLGDGPGMDAFAACSGGEVPFASGCGSQHGQWGTNWAPGGTEWAPEASYDASYYGEPDSESEDEFEGTDAENLEYYGDLSNVTYDEVRHQYLVAKRRFRRFTGRPPRRHRLGKGKGKDRGKGYDPRSSGSPAKGGGRGHNPFAGGHYMQGGPINSKSLAGGKGRGKGLHGAQAGVRKLNPIGTDGQRMLCHECDSDQHLIKDCPRQRHHYADPNAGWANSMASGGASSFGAGGLCGVAPSPGTHFHFATPAAPEVQDPHQYPVQLEMDDSCYMCEADVDVEGAPVVANAPQAAAPRKGKGKSKTPWRDPCPDERPRTSLLFPWWHQPQEVEGNADKYSYLVKLTDRDGEALLVDPGSPDNLVGDRWCERQARHISQAGLRRPQSEQIPTFRVGGVGKHAQECNHKITNAIGLEDGSTGSYAAPVIPDSDVPALLGLKSLTNQRAIIDTYNNKLYLVGPGGYKIQMSPGSKVHDLKRSNTGHLLLPCSEFGKSQRADAQKRVSFPTERHEAPAVPTGLRGESRVAPAVPTGLRGEYAVAPANAVQGGSVKDLIRYFGGVPDARNA